MKNGVREGWNFDTLTHTRIHKIESQVTRKQPSIHTNVCLCINWRLINEMGLIDCEIEADLTLSEQIENGFPSHAMSRVS